METTCASVTQCDFYNLDLKNIQVLCCRVILVWKKMVKIKVFLSLSQKCSTIGVSHVPPSVVLQHMQQRERWI